MSDAPADKNEPTDRQIQVREADEALARLSPKEVALMDQLTSREQLFILEYLDCLDGRTAAERAGFSPRYVSKLVQRPAVRAALKRFLANEVMPLTEVIARLSRIAKADMRHFLDIDEETGTFSVNLKKAADAGMTGLIREVGYTKEGPKVKLHDARQALIDLTKLHGATEGIRKAGDAAAWSNFFEDDMREVEDADYEDVTP